MIITMNKTRTRFAPSPTGYMHIGNLRTALFEFLIAKHEGGDFLLRIEDTDQERKVEGAVDVIYKTLKECGLNWDEGPDIGGDFGPYVQSERLPMYKGYAEDLIKLGGAHYCFCSEEEIEAQRKEAESLGISFKFNDPCKHLSAEEVQAKLDAGEPYVIRQTIKDVGETYFDDEVYGRIEVDGDVLDEQILIKSDGYPTYNFANVVDDHLMGITHVVRGNEYLSSTPKYNRLYDAFGWEKPVYIHCPLITDEEHHKLSKRKGHSSFEDLIEQGFLPETIVNFVALLGWSPGGEQEIFSLKELEEIFDYKHMSKTPAVFDMNKIKWMNGEYIKAMDFDRFKELAMPYVTETIHREMDFDKILSMVKTRIELFTEIPGHIDFFEAVPEYDVEMYKHKKMKTTPETSLTVLKEIYPVIEAQEDFTNDALYEMLVSFAKGHEYKNGYVMWPVRTAVSGKQMTPGGATELMELLGKEESLKRINDAIAKLEAALA